MCPACWTTLIVVAGGTTSAGGLAVLAVKKFTSRGKPRPLAPQTTTKPD
jgi:hypothetical protein